MAGKRPRHRFQRFRKRCSHFFAAALRAGRHEAAHLWCPLFVSMAKAHRLSHTNCGGGATPCALFCSPIQCSRRASSTNLCASLCMVRGRSLQSSHWASVSTGVSRKRVSISRVKASTSSSMARAYFRRVEAAMVGPALGSWQKAIVPVSKACSRCLRRLARSFRACRRQRVTSAELRANSAATFSMARRASGRKVATSPKPNVRTCLSPVHPFALSLPHSALTPSLHPAGPASRGHRNILTSIYIHTHIYININIKNICIYIYIYRRSHGEAIQHWNTAEHCNDSASALSLSLFEICRRQGAEYEIKDWE